MLTDALTRGVNRPKFLESDRLTALHLPQGRTLVEIAHSIESAMAAGKAPSAHKACSDLLHELSAFYCVPPCDIRVLAARPLRIRERWTSELFGDYSPDTMVIRV